MTDIATLPVAAAATPLQAGQQVVHRLFTGDQLACVRTGVLVGHDERGLRLWYSAGNPGCTLAAADGRRIRDMPFAEWKRQRTALAPAPWAGPDTLMLVRPAAAHAVWWFFHPDGFTSWYVNLEEPAVVWQDGDVVGVDTTDQDLDVVARPDGTWAWKDEDEFTERLAHPDAYWVADEAAVRAEGRRAIRSFAAGDFPFDGTWCDWQPDPAWQLPRAVPETAYRPRVHYGR